MDALVKFSILLVMLRLVAPRKYSELKTCTIMIAMALVYFIFNHFVETKLNNTVMLTFFIYVFLNIAASYAYSCLCLQGSKPLFLVLILFFNNYIIFVTQSVSTFGLLQWIPWLILLCIALLYKLIVYEISIHLSKLYWTVMIITPIIILIIIFIRLMNANTVILSINYRIFASLMLILNTLILFLFMRLIYELVELSTLKLSNQKLKFQVKQAEFTYESNERIRKLRHELKNKFFTIETLLENGNYDELKHFIDKEIGAPLDSSMVINTGSHLLDMILTQKSTEAHQKNLPFRMDILLSSLPALDDHQLSSLMFNLLDNAFEASEHTDNPDIYLHIWPQKGYTWIQLKNKCSSSVLSVNPNLCTVKPDKEGHGFGIGIIRGIVSEAGGKIAFGEKDNYFVVSIMLPAQNDSYQ